MIDEIIRPETGGGNGPSQPSEQVPPRTGTIPNPFFNGGDGPAFARPNVHEARRLSREQVRQIRTIEAAGVPFYLHRTGIEATVKGISMADKAMLGTLPNHLQDAWARALNKNKGGDKNKTFADYMRAAENDEQIANVCCVAGFIHPRLTLTEDEADRAGDDVNVWWVGELHIEERKRYMQLCIGTASEDDLKRIAGFLDSWMENPQLG